MTVGIDRTTLSERTECRYMIRTAKLNWPIIHMDVELILDYGMIVTVW